MGRVAAVLLAVLADTGARAVPTPAAECWGDAALGCPAEGREAWPEDRLDQESALELLQRRGAKVSAELGKPEAAVAKATPGNAASRGRGTASRILALAESVANEGSQEKNTFLAVFAVLSLLLAGLGVKACKDSADYAPTSASGKFGSLARLKTTVFVAALCHFCMSYHAGIIAGAWLYINRDPNLPHMGGWTCGAVTSSLLLGATVGALGSTTVDIVGRRLALLSVASLYAGGAAIMGFAPSIGVLLIGRVVAGLGVGMSSVVVNVYISEIAPADCRGQLSGWAPALGTFGILLAQVVSLALGSAFPVGAWRWQLSIVAVPSLAIVLCQGLLVESPRWLLLKGRNEQAAAVMAILFPNAPQDVLSAEIQTIEADINATKAAHQLSPVEVCRRHSWPVALGVGINVLQQVTGINVVIYFGPTVLKELGLDDSGALFAAIAFSGVQLFTVVLSATLVDRIGRRPVALVGMMAIICGHVLLVVAFAAQSTGHGRWQAMTAVIGMLVFRAAFSFSLGPLPYIMTAEMFPMDARAAGAALSWAANWATNFLVCQSFPVVEERLEFVLGKDIGTSLIFAFYLSFCVAAFAVVLRVLPETSHRQLERALEDRSRPAA